MQWTKLIDLADWETVAKPRPIKSYFLDILAPPANL